MPCPRRHAHDHHVLCWRNLRDQRRDGRCARPHQCHGVRMPMSPVHVGRYDSNVGRYALKGVLYKRLFYGTYKSSTEHSVKHSTEHSAGRQEGVTAEEWPATQHTPAPMTDAAVTVGQMGVWSCLYGPAIMAVAHYAGLEVRVCRHVHRHACWHGAMHR